MLIFGPFAMPDERSLPNTAREAIRAGKLPMQRPIRTLGGHGSGQLCALCDETIRYDQMELELEFTRRAGDATVVERYVFHPRCCRAWERALEQFGATND